MNDSIYTNEVPPSPMQYNECNVQCYCKSEVNQNENKPINKK